MTRYRFPKDPFAAREHEKYEHPLPSREYLQAYFGKIKKARTLEDVLDEFKLDEEEIPSLNRRLRAMCREGQLTRNRRGDYVHLNPESVLSGTVIGHRDGFGFLNVPEEADDYFITAREMQKVMHGDKVRAILDADSQGRDAVRIIQITEHALTQVVGQLCYQHGVAFVVPDAVKITHDIVIGPEDINGALEFQWVVAEILHYPKKGQQARGKIIEVLGEDMAPGLEVEIALRNHQIPHEFSELVMAEASAIPQTVECQQLPSHKDLRELAFVTIDGEDAKDFDDAVYVTAKDNGGWQLYVAIADVSSYIAPDSELDKEAVARGNSVYFPGRVVPMLPEALSNGICSLMPKVDRQTMVCECHFNAQGDRESYQFYPAVIRSKARLTYTQVGQLLEESDTSAFASCLELLPALYDLYGLYEQLLGRREARGAIEFATTETQIIFGPEKKIAQIQPVYRNVAHRIIEECMLAANVAASEFVQKHEATCLFRNHEVPNPEKIAALREFLQDFGLSLGGGDSPRPQDYATLLTKINDREEQHLLQTVVLRSLMQAQYHHENEGHFGLGFTSYTHFTSPIRRYPDLLLHRAIKAILANTAYRPNQHWAELGAHCSMTERRADEATREVTAWLKCEYMQDHLGEEYTGFITGVANFGLFVTLDEVFVEGLIPVATLQADYFVFDNKRHSLTGERTKISYRLGDKVAIRIVQVSLAKKQIEFELITDDMETAAPSKRRKKKRRKEKK